jgi:multicomponent Na+:H+ antiporter subunit G
MTMGAAFTYTAVGLGVMFFVAGTLGLLRFPDTLSRLHALSKADNLGLGLIVLGLLPQVQGLSAAVGMIAVWFLVILASASAAQLVAAVQPAARRESLSTPAGQDTALPRTDRTVERDETAAGVGP